MSFLHNNPRIPSNLSEMPSQSVFKKNFFSPLRSNGVTRAGEQVSVLAAREGAIATPLKRWRLAFPMYAGGEIEHVLNHTGGSWYTRNYTVFIGHGSRTAFRSAYRGCDASLLHGAPMKSHGWPHSLSQYFRCVLRSVMRGSANTSVRFRSRRTCSKM